MRVVGRAAFLAAGLLYGIAVPANAALITFDTEAAFLAAAGGGLATADFEALSSQTFQTLNNSVNATIPVGVTFSSSGGDPTDLFVAPAAFMGNTAIATASLFAAFFDAPLFADFSPGVTAVGSRVIAFSFGGSTSPITVSVRNQNGATTDYVVLPPAGSSDFFGVIATGGESITRVTYDPIAGFTAGVDDFRFGATAVPEPGLSLLLGSVLLGFALRRRS
jgi:hypothetical protein